MNPRERCTLLKNREESLNRIYGPSLFRDFTWWIELSCIDSNESKSNLIKLDNHQAPDECNGLSRSYKDHQTEISKAYLFEKRVQIFEFICLSLPKFVLLERWTGINSTSLSFKLPIEQILKFRKLSKLVLLCWVKLWKTFWGCSEYIEDGNSEFLLTRHPPIQWD